MRYKIFVVDWVDLFTRKTICDIVLSNLAFYKNKKGLKIFAYVIMSNHIHLIVNTFDSKSHRRARIVDDNQRF